MAAKPTFRWTVGNWNFFIPGGLIHSRGLGEHFQVWFYLPKLCHIIGKGVIWIGSREKGLLIELVEPKFLLVENLNGEENCADLKSRAPLVLQDVQADPAQLVNVRVVDPGDEPHLHRSCFIDENQYKFTNSTKLGENQCLGNSDAYECAWPSDQGCRIVWGAWQQKICAWQKIT